MRYTGGQTGAVVYVDIDRCCVLIYLSIHTYDDRVNSSKEDSV